MLNKYKKLNNESNLEYQYRISTMKDEIGTWQDVADIINEELGYEYGESKYRKDFASFSKLFSANQNKLTDTDIRLAEIDEKEFNLKKERQKLFDQRREYNKLVRQEARAEYIEGKLVEAADGLAEVVPFINVKYNNDYSDNEVVVFFSDWHYGMTTDNIFNKYNIEICKQRVNKFVDKCIDVINLHKANKLHVALLGDLAHGSIHVTARIEAEETTSNQLMQVSELVAEAINKMSHYVDSTMIYSTYGNHLRTIQNKNESIHADNIEKIVPWWLKQRFKDRDDICVVDSEFYEFIYMNVCGYNICCTHGDLDNIRDFGVTMNTIFTRLYGSAIDYTVSADKHHIEQLDRLGIDGAIVPALCGTDGYANDKRLYSNPAQTIMVFNPEYGKDAVYNVRLN